MNLSNLILQHKEKTKALFCATRSTLPKIETPTLRQNASTPKNQILRQYNLPEVANDKEIVPIAPMPIIDQRPLHAREEVQNNLPPPKPHKQWHIDTVITGHTAWVKCVAVDPSNRFFVTGSSDQMIKVWDLARKSLDLTLTGHVGTVLDLKIDRKTPYLYSCSDDKEIYCWDLSQNSVIRTFHGHLSGVYCLDIHPNLDLIASGSRDSSIRIWDVRTRLAPFVLSGHENTIFDVIFQSYQPNVISSSADGTIRTWDLRKPDDPINVITNHLKIVRTLCKHPTEWSFASASADSIYQWVGANSQLYKEFKSHNAIINDSAINQDNVFVTCGNDGSLQFWDWESASCFQRAITIPQPGSLECENGIFGMAFDMTGTRLITCEADKTVKIWKEFDDGK